ncbi:thiocillin family RiPP [Streptococcus sobrinus]|uniref:thiocillin family RiPP n=1 Tax=Streptococcus sobrinus TaxID=1310 RepID=UPI00037E1E8C|nr:thiocillin family RiPP [Streptococcus sobrinus]
MQNQKKKDQVNTDLFVEEDSQDVEFNAVGTASTFACYACAGGSTAGTLSTTGTYGRK